MSSRISLWEEREIKRLSTEWCALESVYRISGSRLAHLKDNDNEGNWKRIFECGSESARSAYLSCVLHLPASRKHLALRKNQVICIGLMDLGGKPEISKLWDKCDASLD